MKKESGRNIDSKVEEVGKVYSSLVEQHGIDPRSVGYKDQPTQHLRYSRLAQIFDAEDLTAGTTMNELGCGYGAFFDYVDARFPSSIKQYYGYDISDEMLSQARRRLPEARCKLMNSRSITMQADYSFLSGIFNVKLDTDEQEWKEYVQDTLRQSFARSNKGLGVMFLTSYVDWRNEQFFYASPEEFFSFCQKELSRHVSVLHDYPLFEWTLLVRK